MCVCVCTRNFLVKMHECLVRLVILCVDVTPNPRETKVYAQHVMHTFGYMHTRQSRDDSIVLGSGSSTSERKPH